VIDLLVFAAPIAFMLVILVRRFFLSTSRPYLNGAGGLASLFFASLFLTIFCLHSHPSKICEVIKGSGASNRGWSRGQAIERKELALYENQDVLRWWEGMDRAREKELYSGASLSCGAPVIQFDPPSSVRLQFSGSLVGTRIESIRGRKVRTMAQAEDALADLGSSSAASFRLYRSNPDSDIFQLVFSPRWRDEHGPDEKGRMLGIGGSGITVAWSNSLELPPGRRIFQVQGFPPLLGPTELERAMEKKETLLMETSAGQVYRDRRTKTEILLWPSFVHSPQITENLALDMMRASAGQMLRLFLVPVQLKELWLVRATLPKQWYALDFSPILSLPYFLYRIGTISFGLCISFLFLHAVDGRKKRLLESRLPLALGVSAFSLVVFAAEIFSVYRIEF